MTPPIPIKQFISNLPALLRISWFAMGSGFLLLAIGYSLRRETLSLAGGGLFLTGYALGYADYRLRRNGRDQSASYYVGLTVAPIAAGYFHLLMLVVGLIGAGIMAWVADLDRSLMLRLLHFWIISLSFSIFLMVTKLARRADLSGLR